MDKLLEGVIEPFRILIARSLKLHREIKEYSLKGIKDR